MLAPTAHLPAVYAAAPPPPPAHREPPPRSLVEVLLGRKWTIIFWVLIGAGLGALHHHYAPVKYESRAEIVVLRANPEAPASPLSSAGLSTSAPSTHAAMLVSNAVLEQALADPAIADSTLLREAEHPIYFLRKELKVSASDETETVSIRFVGENPQEAADLIAAVLHAYFAQQGIPIRGMTPQENDRPTTSVIDEQVIASKLLFLSQQISEAKIESDLARARRDRAIAAGRDINQLQQILQEAGVDAQTIGLVNLFTFNRQLSLLDQQLRSMPPAWGPNHRMRVQVQNEHDELVEQYIIAETLVREQAVAHMQSLYHQAQSHRAELDAELERLQAKADQARPTPVRVIDPPRVATRRSSPIKAKSYGVGIFMGFFLGCCFAVRAEMRNPRTLEHDTALAQAEANQPPPAPTNVVMNTQDDLDQLETVREVPLLGAVPNLRIGDRLTTPNFTSTASSMHQIRAVLQIQANQKGTQSYAFTSPRRGAGKTSITIGVASSLAIAGTRTLVVDCDLAARIVRGQVGRPANPGHIDPFGPIDRQIGSPDSQSLDDIAVGQGYIRETPQQPPVASEQPPKVGVVGMLEGRSLEDCAVQATVDGLWLLPASEAETEHIGMMSDAFIRDLLEQARDRFDLVLFDTGPVPGSVEALLVTSQADGAIVVIPNGENSKALDKTMSYLKVVGAEVIGTVFNQGKPTGPDNFEQASANGQQSNNQHTPRDDEDQDLDEHHGDIGQDIDDAMDDVPLGSGILAAAVFADKEAGFGNAGWELKGTSEFPGETMSPESEPSHRRPIEPSDILPPE